MTEVRAKFPDKLAFLFQPSRYKVAHGGRGSGKSWGFARALLILAAQRKMRVLCAREIQLSIHDSVHKLLKEQISELGLDDFYEVNQTAIRGVNGSDFLFSGLRSNITKIKSMEAVDIAWCEEAEKISEESWRVLIPTIRRPGSEIWVSFNPNEDTDPTYQRFVVKPPPDAVVSELNWQDNPWFPPELAKEKDYDYSVDPDAADHTWGGKTRNTSDAQILHGKWVVEPFVPDTEKWSGPYIGADWGFSSDPTAMVKCWVFERRLYIEQELYKLGVETVDLPGFFAGIEGSKTHVVRADNARPENISHCQKNGFPKMTAARKWPGSVEDGISHLRSYEKIIIHSQCKHFSDEARLYSYKVDRLTEDVLPDVIDKHNHLIDSCRYALDPLIKKSKLDIGDGKLNLGVGLGGGYWNQMG
jgi:phage terminase large subunit